MGTDPENEKCHDFAKRRILNHGDSSVVFCICHRNRGNICIENVIY